MDDFFNKIMNLLRYVPYLKEEKAKIQRFVSCLSFSYREIIEFDNPKTMDQTIRKENLCFYQNHKKYDNSKGWMTKKNEKFNIK